MGLEKLLLMIKKAPEIITLEIKMAEMLNIYLSFSSKSLVQFKRNFEG